MAFTTDLRKTVSDATPVYAVVGVTGVIFAILAPKDQAKPPPKQGLTVQCGPSGGPSMSCAGSF